jgi:hypothetical protein
VTRHTQGQTKIQPKSPLFSPTQKGQPNRSRASHIQKISRCSGYLLLNGTKMDIFFRQKHHQLEPQKAHTFSQKAQTNSYQPTFSWRIFSKQGCYYAISHAEKSIYFYSKYPIFICMFATVLLQTSHQVKALLSMNYQAILYQTVLIIAHNGAI